MMANSLGGIGMFKKNPKQFAEYYNKSERFRRIMDIVKYAFVSDIEVLKAYIDCFDPGMWSWSTRTADLIEVKIGKSRNSTREV